MKKSEFDKRNFFRRTVDTVDMFYSDELKALESKWDEAKGTYTALYDYFKKTGRAYSDNLLRDVTEISESSSKYSQFAMGKALELLESDGRNIQTMLEQAVGMFDGLARGNSPHKNGVLGAYIFAAGAYIFFGTLFELFGIPWITINGESVTLPAPLSDINGAIAMGGFTYLFILIGGIAANRGRGLLRGLKEFSLPISMSFRLFGALLSGMLVTELVYYYFALSFVVPVIVGILFTVLHAVIQAYVLSMLTSMYYGEVTEPPVKKTKRSKKIKRGSEVTV